MTVEQKDVEVLEGNVVSLTVVLISICFPGLQEPWFPHSLKIIVAINRHAFLLLCAGSAIVSH